MAPAPVVRAVIALTALHEPVLREQAAALLVEAFPEVHGWPTLQRARDEVDTVTSQGFAIGAVEGNDLLGWVGALPEYDGRVWELHPLVVRSDRRRQGIGRALCAAFEREAAGRGGLTATLGTDDHTGATSLADVDLYADVPGHIARLCDKGTHHPFLFYLKVGYVVTGVMPDANGDGKPDIYLSKRLTRHG